MDNSNNGPPHLGGPLFVDHETHTASEIEHKQPIEESPSLCGHFALTDAPANPPAFGPSVPKRACKRVDRRKSGDRQRPSLKQVVDGLRPRL